MFCDLDDVKDWLGIKGATDDKALTRLIVTVTKSMQSYMNRDIIQTDYTDMMDGTGTGMLVLPSYPVTAVASLTVDGRPVTGYTFNENGVYLTNGAQFTRDRNNVQVQYTAGFPTVPDDLAQACIETTAMRWKERTRIGHASQTMAGSGETVSFSLLDFNAQTKTLMNQYRKVFPA